MNHTQESFLSKTDFKVASGCAKKLVYRKQKYPNIGDDDARMKTIAEGGHIVGKMATLMFPGGIEISMNTAAALYETDQALKLEKATLFEAAFLSNGKLVRVDILQKNGNELHLMEVKSSTLEDGKKIPSDIILDIAYQYHVLSELYPEKIIRAFLITPDKKKETQIEGLQSWFTAHREDQPWYLPGEFQKLRVSFRYEDHPERDARTEELRREQLLVRTEVTEQVQRILPEVEADALKFRRILDQGIRPEDYRLCKACQKCEYRVEDEEKSGFAECWAGIPQPEHHIFDLFKIGSSGSRKSPLLDRLIEEGKLDMLELDMDVLRTKKGDLGANGQRQMVQIDFTRAQQEWMHEELRQVLSGLEYPLHFIDFETYTGAIPMHAGMRPYEQLAFQWSCHTIPAPGADLVHSEWIGTGNEFPNFAFAQSLKEAIGYEGTPMMWSHHERSTLRNILSQMERRAYADEELKSWLEYMINQKQPIRPEGLSGTLLDLEKLALKNYFHPMMKGKTSIKKVLPAICTEYEGIKDDPWFADMFSITGDSPMINPYLILLRNKEFEGNSEAINNGSAAMQAYFRLRADETLTEAAKTDICDGLKAYCALDTLAMVMIWKYWVGRTVS